jgi:hypothetical protein
MAHTTGTTARVQRLTALVAIVLIAMAVGFAFGRVFVGHAATYRLLAVGVASAVIAWLFERRSLLLATVVSAALLVVAIGMLVFPETTWYGAPTLETLRQVGHAAAQVGEEARIQISPAPANPSLMLAAITAVWAAVFSCFALAFRAGSPLLSLVPPVALVAFADSVLDGIIKPVYGVLFLIAALAVVFADSLRRIHGWGPVWSPPGARNRLLPSAGRGARRVGAGVVVLAAIAPIVVPGYGTKAVIDLETLNSDPRVHVSPLVEIGAILRQGDQTEVFQVHTDQPAYWRMIGLDQIDANGGWTSVVVPGTAVQPGQPLPGQDPIDPATGVTFDATFTVQSDLAFTTLPIAYQPSELLSSEGSVTWFPGTKTMTVADWPNEGSQYAVRSVYPTPTANELRVTPLDPSAGGVDETQLPTTPLPPEIQQLAERWTQKAGNDFDKIIAIQDEFHSSDFSYNQEAVYDPTLQSIAEFLTVRRVGFCEQYANAMAVMLRSIGIPARVATGFTQGSPVEGMPDTYSVDTSDLHAWVEVPFQGYGWLPFEPTPGTMVNPEMASYMSTVKYTVTCPPGVKRCNDGSGHHTGGHPGQPKGATQVREQSAPINQAARQPTTTDLPEPGGGIPSSTVVAWLALAAALVMATIPSLRWLRRRRRLLHAGKEPRALVLATYDVFSERAADLGLGRGPGETPGEYRRRIESTDLLTDGHMERLTGTVVRAAYSARRVTDEDARDVTADADRVIRDLRRATPLRRRIFGIYRRD